MTVTLLLGPALRERAGGRSTVHVDADSVGTALHTLTERFPELHGLVWGEDGSLSSYLVVLLHDLDVSEFGGLDTALAVGDELRLEAIDEVGR